MMVISMSVKESRIIENFKSTEIVLSPDVLRKLKSLDKNFRFLKLLVIVPDGTPRLDVWNEREDNDFEL